MATMTQEQLDKRIGELGGGNLKHSDKVGSVQIANPNYNKYDANSQEKIDADVEQWKSPDGTILQAAHLPDGSWSIVRDEAPTPAARAAPVGKQAKSVTVEQNPATGKPSQKTVWDDGSVSWDDTQVPASATGEAKPPTTEDHGGHHYVWQPNPGGPNAGGQWVDAGSAPETPAEREARLANEPSQSVATKVANGKTYTLITIVPKPGQQGTTQVKTYGPDGKEVAGGLPAEVGQEKTTTVTRNGTTYIQHEQPDPTTGKTRVFFTDQSGKEVPLPDDNANSFGVLPKGVAQFVPDYSQPDLGLTARRDQLNELVQSGQIDKQTAKAVLTQDAALADVTQSHGTALANQDSTARGQDITQRGQDLGEVASRRTASDGTFQNVFDQINQNARYLGPGGGGLASKAFVDALDLSEAKARQVGGYQDVPQIAPTPAQSNRTIKIGKDGSVSIAVPHPTPAPEQPAAAASAPPSSDAAPASAPSTTVPGGAESSLPSGAYSGPTGWDFTPTGANPATVSAIRPSGPVPFDPSGTVAMLREKKVPEDVIQQALAEHQQEMAQAA